MRKVTEEFICQFCNKSFSTEEQCDRHELKHDIVYIGLEREEWKNLILSIVNANNWGFPFNQETLKKLLKYKVGVTR